MKLTRERAIELHRQMWTDMQREFGDKPAFIDRFIFKADWHRNHFPKENIVADCFLCEYARQFNDGRGKCEYCPIDWSNGGKDSRCSCTGGSIQYDDAPISVILALPEREVTE